MLVMADIEGYLTVSELAERSGLTPSYVRRLIRDGRIDARRIGTMWVVEQREAERFLSTTRPFGRPKSLE